jgi:hypothetical protein
VHPPAPPRNASASAPAKNWAKAGTGDADHSALLSKLQPGERKGTSKVPFPVADRDSYVASVKQHGSVAAKTHGAPIALVNLKDLHAIQKTVNDERLQQHLSDPDMVQPGTRGTGHGGLVDKPVVVKKDEQLYIHDGHHRLTAASLRGQETAKVRLVDLDAGAGGAAPVLGEDRAS